MSVSHHAAASTADGFKGELGESKVTTAAVSTETDLLHSDLS